ncbi:MAG: ArsR family transcriptional regulator [Candidatus Bathyarchaeota archaeon]|nr:ArsR family transcriptional regulator [Candidatus Bathyarchaeota archaeon]
MESLTHTFSIKALLILLREDRRMTVEEIAASMGEPHGSVVHSIDALREAGVVEAKTRRGEPYVEDVSLTPAGRIAAGKLKEIESAIGWAGRGGIT